MSTRELIRAAIENVPEEKLDALYSLVRRFTASEGPSPVPDIMTKLQGIQIEAPADFAANLDLYLSGEKRVGEDVR